MTNEEMNMAIAEACGWSQIENVSTIRVNGLWMGYPPSHPIINQKVELPDYCNDLNAMHEAEKALTKNQIGIYEAYLGDTVKEWQTPHASLSTGKLFKWVHTTAAQRCEAFLKTLNLWKDE